MDYIEETLNTIQEYFSGKGECYEKKEGSSYKGIIAKDKETGILVDIRLTKNGTLIYEAFPGIRVYKEYLEEVTMYCQRIKSRFGTVYVKEHNRNVLFHAESSVRDNPISELTIKTIEEEAYGVLQDHLKNLEALACGHGLDVQPVKEKKNKETNTISLIPDLEKNIEICRAYLAKSNHNAICENNDKNNDVAFFSQMLTNDEVFRFKYVFDDTSGMLSVTAEFGENSFVIKDPYKYAICMIMNHFNSRFACGNLRINEDHSYNAIVSVSLMDGVLSEETYDYLEHCLVSLLHEAHGKIERVGSGHLINMDDDEDNTKEVRNIIEEALEAAGKSQIPRFPSLDELMKSKGIEIPDPEFIFPDEDETTVDDGQEIGISMEECLESIDEMLKKGTAQDGDE